MSGRKRKYVIITKKRKCCSLELVPINMQWKFHSHGLTSWKLSFLRGGSQKYNMWMRLLFSALTFTFSLGPFSLCIFTQWRSTPIYIQHMTKKNWIPVRLVFYRLDFHLLSGKNFVQMLKKLAIWEHCKAKVAMGTQKFPSDKICQEM